MNPQARFNQEFGSYLHKVVALIDRRADRALKAQANMSLSQFLVLLSIDASSGFELSQQGIADQLGINKAAISRHIDGLVEQGWVERSALPTSKRQNQLAITEAGLQQLRAGQRVMEATMSPYYRVIGEAQAQQILEGLKAMCASLEKDEA